MPKLTIDDREFEVPEGKTILQVALENGIHIPHYCYHPDLSIDGNCRMCLVEVEGMWKLPIACSTPVSDGMVVHTKTDKAKKAHESVMEFLLLNHPIDCPICDQAGECGLQDYYMEHGLHQSRIGLREKVLKRKVIDLGEMIVLDTERCILCSRCVRFFNEVTHTGELQFFERGDRTEIGTYNDNPIDNPYSGNVVDICPVGALTSKDFRFKQRVWFLKGTKSICPTCSTGCKIRIDHNKGTVQRLVPRRNPEVNQSWICDKGRMAYPMINGENRLLYPLIRNGENMEPATLEKALARVVDGFKNIKENSSSDAIAGIASPQGTNEDLFLFKKLVKEGIGSPHLDFRCDNEVEKVGELEDKILRRKDENPNTRGALALGLIPKNGGKGTKEILNSVKEGKIKGLYLQRPLERFPDKVLLSEALQKAEFVVIHATHFGEELNSGHVILPSCTYAEKDGTFTNYEDRVQGIHRAFPPSGESKPDWEVFRDLLNRFGVNTSFSSAREVFDQLSKEEKPFQGLTLEDVGDLGVRLKS
jgi:NADH-quinone oxidoreductase subunit G